MSEYKPPILQISGYSNSGKTTLLTQIIAYFSAKGMRVAVIKHDGGHEISLDQEGKDTWRYHAAGAPLVAIQSKTQAAWFEYTPVGLGDMINRLALGRPDLILIEGYKSETYPKLLLIRREADKELLGELTDILAVVSWVPLHHDTLPVFSIDDVSGIIAFVQTWYDAQ